MDFFLGVQLHFTINLYYYVQKEYENDFQEDFLFIIQKSSIYVNEYSVIIFNLSFLKGVGLTK